MDLFILRHGTAEDGNPLGDFHRALTSKGRAQSRAAGKLLAAAELLPQVVLCSPLVRARQTAEEFCDAAGLPGPVCESWLSSGSRPETMLQGLTGQRDFKRVLIVGHEPDLSTLIGESLDVRRGRIVMKKGALACVTLNPPAPAGELRFLLPPALIREL